MAGRVLAEPSGPHDDDGHRASPCEQLAQYDPLVAREIIRKTYARKSQKEAVELAAMEAELSRWQADAAQSDAVPDALQQLPRLAQPQPLPSWNKLRFMRWTPPGRLIAQRCMSGRKRWRDKGRRKCDVQFKRKISQVWGKQM